MSAVDLTECSDNEKATSIIKETIKLLVGEGRIHSRDDIIRHLCGAKFDIVEVTGESITLCAPDEPQNTSTLRGWLFSNQFVLSEGCGASFPQMAPGMAKTDKEAKS